MTSEDPWEKLRSCAACVRAGSMYVRPTPGPKTDTQILGFPWSHRSPASFALHQRALSMRWIQRVQRLGLGFCVFFLLFSSGMVIGRMNICIRIHIRLCNIDIIYIYTHLHCEVGCAFHFPILRSKRDRNLFQRVSGHIAEFVGSKVLRYVRFQQ